MNNKIHLPLDRSGFQAILSDSKILAFVDDKHNLKPSDKIIYHEYNSKIDELTGRKVEVEVIQVAGFRSILDYKQHIIHIECIGMTI